MIESLAGGKKLPPDVTRDIAEKTEGVPLFIEELTRMVLESGLLREQDGRYDAYEQGAGRAAGSNEQIE